MARCDALGPAVRSRDNHGHDAGDRILIAVADRLALCVGRAGMVSRFGGDEFVIMLTDSTLAEAQLLRGSIDTALARPFPEADGIRVRTSIGLTFAQPDDRDPEHVLRIADEAMYDAKQRRHTDPQT